jgi:hypothetical protein
MRYKPPDEREVRARREAADDVRIAAQRAAVTAELRAIGIQPDPSKTLLRRVPARMALELCSGMRSQATSLVGRAFSDDASEWIVADVAPSSLADDGHTVAYIFDASKQTAVAGKLILVGCREMEIWKIKAILARNRQQSQ